MKVFFHYSPYGFSNVYLVGGDDAREAILVDPAEINVNLLSFIENNGYYVRAVLVTHNHLHHIKGISTLLKIYDAELYSSNAAVADRPSHIVHDGDVFEACGLKVEAFSVPGHSSDSIVFKIEKLIFTGDTIQAGLVGQTMSSYGFSILYESLTRKVLSQDDDCVILPGHGPPTTVGAERRFNIGFENGFQESLVSKYDFFV